MTSCGYATKSENNVLYSPRYNRRISFINLSKREEKATNMVSHPSTPFSLLYSLTFHVIHLSLSICSFIMKAKKHVYRFFNRTISLLISVFNLPNTITAKLM